MSAAPDDLTDLAELAMRLKKTAAPAGLSEASIETLYAAGYEQLQRGEFDRAQKTFMTLYGQMPGQARFAAGVGHSLMGQKEPELASSWFTLACALDEGNAGYQLSLSRALIGCGHRQLARLALRSARLQANDTPQGQQIQKQASALIELIESHEAATS